jgi:hypothetical protein
MKVTNRSRSDMGSSSMVFVFPVSKEQNRDFYRFLSFWDFCRE